MKRFFLIRLSIANSMKLRSSQQLAEHYFLISVNVFIKIKCKSVGCSSNMDAIQRDRQLRSSSRAGTNPRDVSSNGQSNCSIRSTRTVRHRAPTAALPSGSHRSTSRFDSDDTQSFARRAVAISSTSTSSSPHSSTSSGAPYLCSGIW